MLLAFSWDFGIKEIKLRIDVCSTVFGHLDLGPQASNGRGPWLAVQDCFILRCQSHSTFLPPMLAALTYLGLSSLSQADLPLGLDDQRTHASAFPLESPPPTLPCDSFIPPLHSFLQLGMWQRECNQALPPLLFSFSPHLLIARTRMRMPFSRTFSLTRTCTRFLVSHYRKIQSGNIGLEHRIPQSCIS